MNFDFCSDIIDEKKQQYIPPRTKSEILPQVEEMLF